MTHAETLAPVEIARAIERAGFRAYLTPPPGWKPPGATQRDEDWTGADVQLIAMGGEAVEIEKHLVSGKVTVFDFYADWCEPCHALAQKLIALARAQPGVAIRKIDIHDWDSPAAKRWLVGVPALPYLRIHGRNGRLAAALAADDTSRAEAVIRDELAR